jgi:protein-disulfide isomerase
MKEMTEAGQVKVVYHPMNFLDRNLGNDSSTRAGSAFGCAVDAGVTLDYHTLLFANQPVEGAGYTQEDLKKWGAEAGIAGPALDTFNTCVDGVKYEAWPTLVNEAASLRGVTGTPTLFLNGEEVDRDQLDSPEDLKAQILAAGGQ